MLGLPMRPPGTFKLLGRARRNSESTPDPLDPLALCEDRSDRIVDSLRAQILEQLIADQLLAVHADKTGIEVPEAAVDDELSRALEESRRGAGGDEAFERELEQVRALAGR